MRAFNLTFLLGVVACVTTKLTPEAQLVRVTSNAVALKDCRLIGNVDASDRMNGGIVGQMAAEENANRRLRNKAAEMGANTVLMVAATTGMSGSRARAEAYSCPMP